MLAKYGEQALWTPDTYISALIADHLALLRWQLGGSKGMRPRPVPRPQKRGKVIGRGESWTPESLDEWIALKEAEELEA